MRHGQSTQVIVSPRLDYAVLHHHTIPFTSTSCGNFTSQWDVLGRNIRVSCSFEEKNKDEQAVQGWTRQAVSEGGACELAAAPSTTEWWAGCIRERGRERRGERDTQWAGLGVHRRSLIQVISSAAARSWVYIYSREATLSNSPSLSSPCPPHPPSGVRSLPLSHMSHPDSDPHMPLLSFIPFYLTNYLLFPVLLSSLVSTTRLPSYIFFFLPSQSSPLI